MRFFKFLKAAVQIITVVLQVVVTIRDAMEAAYANQH